MPKASPAQATLDRVSAIGLGFPGAEVKLSHGAPSFHVRGKMFLVFVDDHHHDGRLGVWCKATFDDQKRLVAEDGERFYVPPYVGVKGWVGVRLDHPRTDWIELAILVEEAWASIAPKRLAEGTERVRRAAPMRLPTTDAETARAALVRLTAICTALPDATCERSAASATYRAGKKAFAYFLDNHHGDEIIAACVKVPGTENKKLAKAEPKRFYLPQYMASKGWVGVRLDSARVPWKDIEARVLASYRLVVPKKLSVLV